MTGRFFGGKSPYIIHISSNLPTGINLYSYVQSTWGTPNKACSVIVIVDAGVSVSGMGTGSGWITGTKIRINNYGLIAGKGGDGGVGANYRGNAGNGTNGSNAMQLGWDVEIDNGSGQIFGGGGGGGGGKSDDPGGGGGGGGGQGYPNSAGGAGGSGTPDGEDGGNGGIGSKGIGGADGVGGGKGGNGGAWGANGANGSHHSPVVPGGDYGVAGKAINLNGHVATFISGNDSTHVKGAIA